MDYRKFLLKGILGIVVITSVFLVISTGPEDLAPMYTGEDPYEEYTSSSNPMTTTTIYNPPTTSYQGPTTTSVYNPPTGHECYTSDGSSTVTCSDDQECCDGICYDQDSEECLDI